VASARRLAAGPIVAAAALLILVGACTPAPPAQPTPTLTAQEKKRLPTATPLPRLADSPDAVAPRSSVYLDGLKVPVGLVFAPDGRLFFSEVFTGNVRVAERDGDRARLLEQAFVSLEIAKGAETGVLGLAIDPDFEHNRWVYLYYSEPDPTRRDRVPKRNRVVRFTDRDNVGAEMTVILDDIDIHREGRHNGGRLAFGLDGKLYVSVGNAQDRSHSQDMRRPNGKILRINPDGSIPADNPFPGSPIYALGFRNPFGLAIQPETGRVFATDNGGGSNDELNLVRPGGNYGFPNHEGIANDPPFVDPIWDSGSQTIGPTGLTFYSGDQLPQYRGDLFFCAVNTGMMTRLRLAGPESDRPEGAEEVVRDCHLDVANGPDGALYYASMSQILRLGR
jgi:aldose sugar dehydrogenase